MGAIGLQTSKIGPNSQGPDQGHALCARVPLYINVVFSRRLGNGAVCFEIQAPGLQMYQQSKANNSPRS